MATDVVTLPIDPNADPNRPRLDEALEVVQDAASTPFSSADKLARMAQASGDVSGAYTKEKLAEIGARVVADYERDKRDRKDWEDIAREALDACAQEEQDKAKDFPWTGASNMKWPLLTIAAMQFNARMFPAVVKGDEAVLCKVIGSDNGVIAAAPNPQTGEIQPVPAVDPATGQIKNPPEPVYLKAPGVKAKRARRVADYMNTVLFYRMDNWEDDTDALLMQLPAVGGVFRKQWVDETGRPQSATISALNLIVPKAARNVISALRLTEEIEDVYPYEILERQRRGYYNPDADLNITDENGALKTAPTESDGARMLLEQHCRWDFDEDGVPEPYIITVDKETAQVLRMEPNFGPNDIELLGDTPVHIKARQFYTLYPMFPHPKGNFYPMGLGHLLKKLGDGVNTMLNQLIDAGTAQTAGGGFIGSGLRLQARGQKGSIRYQPGRYDTVDIPGDQLRNAIVERTLPNVSSVTFQVLEMILGAARDIAGIKDVMTGEASNQGQVGTTLALIEQGLQVFNSCAKRIFRALKAEFELLYDNIRTFGGEAAAQDYQTVLDDREANFETDFADTDLDIRAVSDPSSITKMQKMAKAQFLLSMMGPIQATGGDPKEVMQRVLEAADVEDIDKIYPPPPPPDPQTEQMRLQQAMESLRLLSANADDKQAAAHNKLAKAMLDAAKASSERFDLSQKAGEHGVELGVAAAQMADPAQ